MEDDGFAWEKSFLSKSQILGRHAGTMCKSTLAHDKSCKVEYVEVMSAIALFDGLNSYNEDQD